ncbi:MAG: acyltransferase [Candidatus Omnitrophota bacterium]
MGIKKVKDQSIETLRGIAVILVVAGFIVQGEYAFVGSGTRFQSWLYFIYNCLVPVRMPLFTVISAYLYAHSPATRETLGKLIRGKFSRLGYPFFVVSTIQYVILSLLHVQGDNPIGEIYRIYLWPFHQFWFIWAIFWIFMLIGYLDSIKALETTRQWFAWLALFTVCNIALDPPTLLGLSGINYLLPFFLLGYGISRFAKELFTPRMIVLYTVMTLLTYAVYIYFRKIPHSGPFYKTLALACSFSVVPLVVHFRRNVPWLAAIGYYAFGIHIFCRIAIAFFQVLLKRLNYNNEQFNFVILLGAGIVCAIGIQRLVERVPVARKYILGMKD